MVWLAPYDLGVSQRVFLRTLPTDDIPGIYRIEMHLQRVKRRCGELAAAQHQLPQRAAQALFGLADDCARGAGGYLIEGEKLGAGDGGGGLV